MTRIQDEVAIQDAVAGHRPSRVALTWLLPWASALLVPVAYIFGRAYTEAWFKGYGLPITAFDVSFEDALFGAYLGVLNGTAAVLSFVDVDGVVLAGVMAVAVAMVFGLLLVWARFSLGLIRLIERCRDRLTAGLRNPTMIRRHEIGLLLRSYVIVSFPVLVAGIGFYAVLFALMPALIGDSVGRRVGAAARAAAIRTINDQDFRTTDHLAVLRDSERSAVWLVVSCNAVGCGITSMEETTFVPWQGIDRIIAGRTIEKPAAAPD